MDSFYVRQAKSLTETIEYSQAPKAIEYLQRKKQIIIEQGKEEIYDMAQLPFPSCPWEWQTDPLCLEVLELDRRITKNPGLYVPDKIPMPLLEAYEAYSNYKSAQSAYWFRKRRDKLEERRRMADVKSRS